MIHPPFCQCCGLSRRQFLKLSGLFTGSLALAAGCRPGNETSTAPSSPANDQPLKIGYLPITDAAPLLIGHSQKFFEQEGLQVEAPTLFRSWPQIIEAFIARKVNAIHLLMPATISLRYGRNFPAKVVAWNHTNGSALTVGPSVNKVEDLAGRTIAVPFWYSVHNVVLQQVLQDTGLKVVRRPREAAIADDEVNLVVLPPPDMISALANDSIGGYIVADPFNAAAEKRKVGKILRFTGDVWKDHACCVIFMHEDDLKERPEWAQRVVNGLVASQAWMRDRRPEVAEILSKDGAGKYTPHPLPILQQALTAYSPEVYGPIGAIRHADWGSDRIDFQPYPFPSYTEKLVTLLQQTQVEGERTFLDQLSPQQVATDLVDDSFVRKAIAAKGGPAQFGLTPDFRRQEVFQVS